MRTIRIKLYKFSELSESAKEKAIEDYRNRNYDDSSFVWEQIQEDAKEIGLNIISLDDHKANKGEFVSSGEDTAKLILEKHGKDCDTYKTAENFLQEWEPAKEKFERENEGWYFKYENEGDEMEADFLQSLLEDYRIMYNTDIDYQNSDEYITETIEANEYEFTKDGDCSTNLNHSNRIN